MKVFNNVVSGGNAANNVYFLKGNLQEGVSEENKQNNIQVREAMINALTNGTPINVNILIVNADFRPNAIFPILTYTILNDSLYVAMGQFSIDGTSLILGFTVDEDGGLTLIES
jgi:hypothetical protein